MSPPPVLLDELELDSPPLLELLDELLDELSPPLELDVLPPVVVPSSGKRQYPDAMHVASASQQLLSSRHMNPAVSIGTHSSRHS